MANELKKILESIREDKNKNLLPSNLKKGIKCLGIDGALETTTTENPSDEPDSSNTTATANDIAEGKTAVSKGEVITGKIQETKQNQIREANISYTDVLEVPDISGSGYTYDFLMLGDQLYRKNSRIMLSGDGLIGLFGVTADKIKKGESILGVTGTLEGKGKVLDFHEFDGVFSMRETSTSPDGEEVVTTYGIELENNLKDGEIIDNTTEELYVYLTPENIQAFETTIKPENIKKDVKIFECKGTYEGGSLDTSDATATAGDLASGKTAYVNGEKVTGSLETYVNGRGTVASGSGISNFQPPMSTGTPPIMFSRTMDEDAVYRNGSTVGIYMPVNQIANHIGLTADKIKSGESILGISGTLESGIDTSDATATAGDILSGKTAYVNGNKLEGTLDNKSTGTVPIMNASDLKSVSTGLGVNVPAGYYNSNNHSPESKDILIRNDALASVMGITSEKIIAGNKIAGVSGGVSLITNNLVLNNDGVTPDDTEETLSIDSVPIENRTALDSDSFVTVSVPYGLLTDSIELTADKIIKGQTILGVEGTANIKPNNSVRVFPICKKYDNSGSFDKTKYTYLHLKDIDVKIIGSDGTESELLTKKEDGDFYAENVTTGTVSMSFNTASSLTLKVTNIELKNGYENIIYIDMTPVLGNVDGDNRISLNDYVMIKDVADGIENHQNCDINQDGVVDWYDYIIPQSINMGNIDEIENPSNTDSSTILNKYLFISYGKI